VPTNVLSLALSIPILYSHGIGSDLRAAQKLATKSPSPPIVYTMKKEFFVWDTSSCERRKGKRDCRVEKFDIEHPYGNYED
jgi:hypothetical protein